MSNAYVNIRIFSYHFKIIKDNIFRIVISKNKIHKEKDWPDGYFSVYDLWPFK